ncbi:MAG TPA: hypothetical protein IGS17_14060 [Oscillatoriales cyanobacterium M59_W2019_021]|nr:hypothetical protein [Oscillatoriales cyanobacterium M4454_W2019_049]HIK52028.1 hypothetical protein [Oscillatoriales cyanobacterium M59_W2019_021]
MTIFSCTPPRIGFPKLYVAFFQRSVREEFIESWDLDLTTPIDRTCHN